MNTPQHLQLPSSDGRTYGDLWKEGAFWILEAEPRVLQVANPRLLGSKGRSSGRQIRFRATARTFEDLNWLLLRFPVNIKTPDKYREELDVSRAVAERRAMGRDLPQLAATARFKGKLRNYQEEGVSFLLHNRRALLADGMGLGKTVMALAALAQENKWPAVVVAPTSVQHQWVAHANTFLQIEGFNLSLEQATILRGQRPYTPDPAPIYVLHYGLLQYWREYLEDQGVRVIVFDEIQELRHTGTQKYSAASALSQFCDCAWGLSGTPIHNYGGEIWAIMNMLEAYCLEDYSSFSIEWCTGYDTQKVANPRLLGEHLRAEGLMMRRQKEDVELQLPPKRRAVIPIDHDQSVYAAAVNRVISLAQDYHQMTDWHKKGQAKREILSETRRATGESKARYVADFVGSLVEAGEKVLLFAWHHCVHDTLCDRLGAKHRVVKVTGRQTDAERQEALGKFRRGESDVIVLSLRTVAGLNGLQDHGTCVVFAELDWSPAIHAQCEDRLHRDGVKGESVLCYYLVANTGYDEVMQEALGLKIGQFKGLMGEAEEESDRDREIGEEDIRKHLDAVIARVSKERKGRAA